MSDRFDQIRDRAEAATPGPWDHVGSVQDYGYYVAGPAGGIETEDSDQGRADAEFIAAARSDVPWLVGEVDRLTSELAQWQCGRRRHVWPTIDSVPDGLHYAAELARAQGTEGGEGHDRLLLEAAMRMKTLHDTASVLLADRNRLRALLAEHGIEVPS